MTIEQMLRNKLTVPRTFVIQIKLFGNCSIQGRIQLLNESIYRKFHIITEIINKCLNSLYSKSPIYKLQVMNFQRYVFKSSK